LKKLTSYSKTLTGLENGEHVFAVTFTLTDGGTASATAEFSISTVATLEETCIAQNGYLLIGQAPSYDWLCENLTSSLAELALNALMPYCSSGLLTVVTDINTTYPVSVTCDFAPPPTPEESCIALGGTFASGSGFLWSCEASEPPYLAESAEAVLLAACSSGAYSASFAGVRLIQFVCLY